MPRVVIKRPSIAKSWGANFYLLLVARLVALCSLYERLSRKRRESRADAVRDCISSSDRISKRCLNPRRPTYMQSCASLANAVEELRLYTHLYTDFVAHASILAQISRMCKSPQILLTFAHIVQVSPPICHKSQVTIGVGRSKPPLSRLT